MSGDELRFRAARNDTHGGSEHTLHHEAAFLAALERVTSYALDGRTLTLLADDDVDVKLAC